MSRWVSGGVGLVWTLGCAGAATAPTTPPPDAAPYTPVARQVRSGPVVPLKLLQLSPEDGRCTLVVQTIGEHAAERQQNLGSFDGTCPRAASLTWHGGRVVLGSNGHLEELGRGPLPLPPLREGEGVSLAVFDDAGDLHACGRTNTPVVRDGTEAVARFDGKVLREGIPAIADGFEVAVRWVFRGGGWERAGEALVYHVVIDGPDDVDPCVVAPGFPTGGHRADSTPPDADYTWEEAPPNEITALDPSGIGNRDWRWDPTRTVAVRSGYDRYRIWAADGWVTPKTLGWATRWWMFEDHVAIGTAMGPVEVFSRRDGQRVHVTGPNTTVIPWPADLPLPLDPPPVAPAPTEPWH